ncbi:MBL fold metallo-hydrolase [Bradymonadaceae bacterium TMQ3]|nr:MBL fold metallo-hydrolase [Bradymonadaceae bacterium TMQ3]TXC67661.1 MBL fold metallo-hydrolase [Bradymonadales bacterium TMQ1]
MIESFYLFHCGYIRVPSFMMIAKSGMQRVRLPLLAGVALHAERGPLLFDAPFGPNGPNNLGGAIGGAMRLFGMRFESEWAVTERVRTLTGAAPDEIAHVFMTHLHYDHTGGLPFLSAARCHVRQPEWAFVTASRRPLAGYARGDLRDLRERIAPFEEAPRFGEDLSGLDLLGDGSVCAFATPGHSPGHASYRVKMADGRHIIFGGDVAFTTTQVVGELGLGSMPRNVAVSRDEVQRSIEELRAHLLQHPTDVLLTSHDLELGERCIQEGPIAI